MWNQVTGGNNRLARRPNTIDGNADAVRLPVESLWAEKTV